ncbi:hypothetical protein [Pseudomonas inefficax]|uniref:hypothetical protein n=1 Tax=Pseudomonas inefficax TaxID=2078786 RepID=UPI002DB8C51C|nr:hypothetical protein [Pseudomonas sp. CMAA1741]MEC4559797.1 hypothetical protein [Pseudomonas sp. CMAA1741]
MIQHDFTAELHCKYGQIGVVETPIYVHPLFSLDQDGWLCTEDQRGDTVSFKPLTFTFRFIRNTGDRVHYNIYGAQTWEYFGASMKKNRNGWLGLYATHILGRAIGAYDTFESLVDNQGQWKIEALDTWDGDLQSVESVPFYLRDQNGYRVALSKSTYIREYIKKHYWFLNAGTKEGEILTFHLKNVKAA